MTGPNQLSGQVRRVAWGYFFLYLDFSLNNISVLPAFVGWILFWKAIQGLKEEQPKLALLEHFAEVLGVWAVLKWLPVELPAWLSLPGLVFQLMGLYFHFQLLTELAQLAGRYQGTAGRDHDQRVLRARTGTTVVQTALVLTVAAPIPEGAMKAAAVMMLLVQMGLCFYTMGELFSLANSLKKLEFPLP